MQQIVDCFKNYLSVVGYSAGIQRMLPACVRDFLAYGGFLRLEQITGRDIYHFYEWLHIRPIKRGAGALSPMMLRHYLYALRVFFSWLQCSGRLPVNPISSLKFRRGEYQTREPLTIAQVQALFTAASCYKELAMLHLFYSCGLRCNEGVQLRLTDVHLNDLRLYVRAGKGQRRRVIPLTERVARDLALYVRQERGAARKDCTAFMINCVNGAMSDRNYLYLFKTLLARVGLDTATTLHHLRHSIATHLLQSGMKLEEVQVFLGHHCLDSTQIYAKYKGYQKPSI